jgi:hypothetical protein
MKEKTDVPQGTLALIVSAGAKIDRIMPRERRGTAE